MCAYIYTHTGIVQIGAREDRYIYRKLCMCVCVWSRDDDYLQEEADVLYIRFQRVSRYF